MTVVYQVDSHLWPKTTQGKKRAQSSLPVSDFQGLMLQHCPPTTQALDHALTRAYAILPENIRTGRYDEVFLLPFLTTGGADRYLLDVMKGLHTLYPTQRMLVIFGEPFEKYAWLDRLPPNVDTLDLFKFFPHLDEETHDRLVLHLIQKTAPHGRLHIRNALSSERFFLKYGAALVHMDPTVYRFCDGLIRHGGHTFIDAGQFAFVSKTIAYLRLLICDNAHIKSFDLDRIGAPAELWQVLYARMDLPDRPNPLHIAAQHMSRRIVWASRLDRQKRPELLIDIAGLLQTRLPNMHLDLYGSALMDDGSFSRALSKMPNVTLHGGFDSFDEIQSSDSFCFLYTSHFDGLPNILLEAASSATPIIAPNIGGVNEFIQDGKTGLLLDCTGDNDADAELYISAIEKLQATPTLREKLCMGAWEKLEAQHAPNQYQTRIDRLFSRTTLRL